MSYIKLSYDKTTLIEFNGSKLKINPFLPQSNRHTLTPSYKTHGSQSLSFPNSLFYLPSSSILSPHKKNLLPSSPSPAMSSTTNSNHFSSSLYCWRRYHRRTLLVDSWIRYLEATSSFDHRSEPVGNDGLAVLNSILRIYIELST
ncbi:uncharacterized protein LOC130808867 [Amaranthus tricolor]|uniref:uncharacterized protein LOC130808867 n=1 Tax=Amaranthus tricolor TaxID=29722 RepID=UPI0025892FEE|nr:uncharacterized protein LOC130808867 [Amaranthus tricolor]